MSAKPRYQPLLDAAPDLLSRTDFTGHHSGVSWLRLPLPFDLAHINLWLLGDGETIVDCGFNGPETRGFLSALWQNQKPANIFITHFHPDHLGLAGWFQAETNAQVIMTAREYELANALCNPDWMQSMIGTHQSFYGAAGADDDMSALLLGRSRLYAKVVSPLPQINRFIADSEEIKLGGRQWQMIEGNGHSPEHACLYNKEDEIFIAGDIVLSDITPNISLFPRDGYDTDPVADYLSCLERIKHNVSNDALVLPSHGVAFFGLHDRIDALTKHHHSRGARIVDILSDSGASSAVEVMHRLFAHRNLGDGDIAFALGETLSHLVWLVNKGDLIYSQDDSGVRHFSTR